MNLLGARVVVMGLGRFGGGLGVTRWLCAQGAEVLVTDLAGPEDLAAPLEALGPLLAQGRVRTRLGGHDSRDFAGADVVVANPAVPHPWSNEYLLAAERAGRPITTEIRLLVERLDRSRTIGITGTAGKSTTSAMVAHALRRLGRPVRFGGNIGGSLLEEAEAARTAGDLVVLELSSFMLHWLGAGVGGAASRSVGWSPRVSAITNIRPNHLDWHGSFEHYLRSKLNLERFQSPGDVALRGEPIADAPIAGPGHEPARPGHPPIALQVPGAHNQVNAQLALRIVHAATGDDPAAIAAALADFPGLPHRLELVAESDGRRFFNDSKSTTPEATCMAVAAFDDPARIHLIAGGYDKGSDLASIAALAPTLGGLHTIGATGRRLAGGASHCFADTLDVAIDRALARMGAGDILLLSPGCASWDQFTNYEARGEAFRALVLERVGRSATPSR